MSKEFRNVHSAQYYLRTYVDSNRNIDIIRSIPMVEIKRYDVWQAVFRDEPDAYRELCRKEWYRDFIDITSKEGSSSMIPMLVTSRMIQLTEWNGPFSVQDAISIIIDIFGIDYLSVLIEEGKQHVKQREEIIKPYFQQDSEWVGYAQTVVDLLVNTYEEYRQLTTIPTPMA